MNQEKQKKVKLAIAKLQGYREGDKVIITSNNTGRTVYADSGLERSWDACRNLKGTRAIITEICTNAIPIGYRLNVEDSPFSNDLYTDEHFELESRRLR